MNNVISLEKFKDKEFKAMAAEIMAATIEAQNIQYAVPEDLHIEIDSLENFMRQCLKILSDPDLLIYPAKYFSLLIVRERLETVMRLIKIIFSDEFEK